MWLVLSGILAAVFSFVWGFYASGLLALSFGLLIAMFIVRVISGALLAGVLGKFISDALAKTGVLRGYALGKSNQKKRENRAS